MHIPGRLLACSRCFVLAFIASSAAGLPAQDVSHRQAEFTVSVRNADGAPLRDVAIRVEMSNPLFRWGCAVTASQVNFRETRHTRLLQRHFNSLTFGNDLKWDAFERRTPEATVAMVRESYRLRAFEGADRIRIRGHTTVWNNQSPRDVADATADEADFIRQRIHDHIALYHATLRGLIDNFDFYNEPLNARDLIQKLVPGSTDSNILEEEIEEVAEWFKIAQEADPEARLFINDFNVMNDWNADDSRVHAYKAYIDRLRDAGAPVGGIGVQGHIDRRTSYEQFARRFAILAAPMAPTVNFPEGLPTLPIEVTELDINGEGPGNGGFAGPYPSPDEQAVIIEGMLRAAFENPAVEGVTVWGMDDATHWRDNAVMFDTSDPANWVLKPSGEVWVDLVQGEWWNREDGVTDSSGSFTTTVFKGTQRIMIRHGDQAYWTAVDVPDAGTIQITLPGVDAPIGAYADWRNRQPWSDFREGMPMADPDTDGIVNFVEYLAGQSPLESEGLEVVEFGAAGDSVTLRYRIRKSAVPDTEVLVESTRGDHAFLETFVTWSAENLAVPVLLEAGPDFDLYEITLPRVPGRPVFYRIEFEDTSHR